MRSRKEGKELHFRIDELFYYLFIAVLMGAKGIGLTEGQKLFTFCLLLAGLCWAVKMCLTGYSWKEWLLTALLMCLSFVIWRRTGEKAVIAAFMVIMGMKGIPLKRLMKVCLAVWGVTFVFSLARGLLGIYEGVVVVHEKLGLGPIIRYSLGYTHPNVLHVTYFIIIMLFIYAFRPTGRKLIWTAVLLFMGNLYIFLYSISYTGMIIVSAYLLMILYFDLRKRLNLLEKGLSVLFVLFCMVFPIAGPFILTGKAFNFFNSLLSTRFELVYNIFHDNQVSLFGTSVMSSEGARLSLDSSFAYMLMYYGIIAFLLIVGLYLYSLYYCLLKNMLQETAILLGTALAGVTEQFLFNLSFKNIALFILGYALFSGILKTEGGKGKMERVGFLLSRSEKGVSVPVPAAFYAGKTALHRIWKEKKGRILACGCVCALLMTAGWMAFGEKTEYVLVEKWATDYRGDEEFVMTEEVLSDRMPHIRVGSISQDCRGYRFEGNAIIMERARCITSALVWGFLDGFVLMSAVQLWKSGINKPARHKVRRTDTD